MTPTPELVALLELSERATQGEWRFRESYTGSDYIVITDSKDRRIAAVGDLSEDNAALMCGLVNWFRSARAEAAETELVAVVTENYCNCHAETCCCSEYALHVDAEVLATGSRARMDRLAEVINTRATPTLPGAGGGDAAQWRAFLESVSAEQAIQLSEKFGDALGIVRDAARYRVWRTTPSYATTLGNWSTPKQIDVLCDAQLPPQQGG